jgi:tetratricopeptide (TPR) repeat protein
VNTMRWSVGVALAICVWGSPTRAAPKGATAPTTSAASRPPAAVDASKGPRGSKGPRVPGKPTSPPTVGPEGTQVPPGIEGAASEAPKDEEDDRPWAKGVAPAEREAARALVREGNQLVEDALFVKAAEKYRAALTHWDNPAIHFNLALALINLDQPVEVYKHLEKALQYGAAPLGPEKAEHARSYRSLIEKQLARVVIVCQVSGAAVTLDGNPLFTGPGRYEDVVRAGPHTVVARRADSFPTEQTRTLPPGEVTTIDLKLYRAEDLTRFRRKWAAWKPWMAVASGIVVAGVGGILHWQGRESIRAFDAGVANDCPTGCTSIPPALAALRSRGRAEQALAIVAYSLGGAGIVTGGVLVHINRPRAYRISPTEQTPALSLAPLIGPGQAGLLTTFRF